MHEYRCFVGARCSTATNKGRWAVLTCPEFAKWTVNLSGKATCKDISKLYLLGAIAAMDDLTQRCGVTLVVDSMVALETLEAIGSGLRPQIGNLALLDALEGQMERHDVTLLYLPHSADKRWKEVIEILQK